MSRVWPAATYDPECYVLLPVPISTIPIVAGKISELEQRSAWASESDWQQGYQFAVCLQECLMQCGQSFSEVMTLLAVALGANEIAEADLSPAFPALAARLAAARTADTAGVLTKQPLTSAPSTIIRLSEILAPFVQAGDPGGATPNLYGVLRSAWNFDSIRVTGLNGNELTEIAGASKEIGALLAVLAGLQEQAIADVKQVWPNVGAELEAAQGRELGNGTDILTKTDAAETEQPSNTIRLSEIARLLQGKFPGTGSLWWYKAGEPVTLYDLYQQQSGLTDEPENSDGVNWIDYVSDLVGIPTDLADLLDAFGLSPGKLKKDGLMIALIAVEFMNLSMTSNLLLNLIGKDKMIQNSPGAPAATHDYLEALLQATRGIGIQRSETDWSDGDAGVGRPPNGTPPPDSVLWALRGVDDNTKAASNTRNVIDTQASSTDLTSVETSLGNIETSLGNIASNTSAMSTAMGSIDLLIDDLLKDEALTDGVNLYELDQRLQTAIEALACICRNTTFILNELPSNEPYGQSSEPADTGLSQPADLCQRVRWLVNNILQTAFAILNTPPITKARVLDVYQRELGVPVPGEFAADIAMIANAYHRDIAVPQGISAPIAWMDYMAPLTDEMVCTLFEGGTAQQSMAKWHVYWDGKGAGALPFASLAKDMIWGDLINALFSQNIPLADDQAALYSNDCSGCSGVGNIVPTTPPGGWNTLRCSHCAYSTNDPYANPSEPQYVYFYRDDPTKYDFANYFSSGGGMPDRWTITTNLKGWRVGFGVLDPDPPGYDIEIYDAGVLLATLDGSMANPPEFEFASDTNSIQLRITSGYNSACLRTPVESSGWPFTGS